jgi:hypothetical protein
MNGWILADLPHIERFNLNLFTTHIGTGVEYEKLPHLIHIYKLNYLRNVKGITMQWVT